MLVDELKIFAKAGKGGDGVVRWRSERGKPKMGPAGGDGGNGADVAFRAVRDVNVLSNYLRKKDFFAKNGEDGMRDSRAGKNGEILFIDLPIGSVVTNLTTNKKIELLKEGEEIVVLKGGRGGLGNEHFKSSKNTTPKEFTLGKEGEESEFFIELRLIADIGFIGLPSAGKSSLLNELTRANAKIGAYPFTTLEPNLGDFYGYILADIPGLIEGASAGKGLGYKFLKHIERTKILAHCISFENEDLLESYKIIREELEKFNPELVEKKEIIILTKFDLADEKRIKEVEEAFKKINSEVQVVSIYDDVSIKKTSDYFTKILKQENLD